MESGSDDSFITNINVTPLVDVSLVLVIIFMAIAPFAYQAGIKASHTKSGAKKAKAALSENVNIVLEENGDIKLNSKITPRAQLGPLLRKAILESKDAMVILRASDKNKVKEVVNILDLAKQSGAKKLAILGKKKKEE
ncbi:ExbD/TolR family protein [Elusimicrobiota bacterium]